jgi:hypothetical protein
MDAVGSHLDHGEASRVDAVLVPTVEFFVPMRGECRFVLDDLGVAFDGDEDARPTGDVLMALQRQIDLRLARDVGIDALMKNQLSPSYSTSPLLLIGLPEISPPSVLVCSIVKSISAIFLARSARVRDMRALSVGG